MNTRRIVKKITTVLYFIGVVAMFVACDNQHGMMNGSGMSMGMDNWNWLQILLSIGFGFFLGFLVFRKKN